MIIINLLQTCLTALAAGVILGVTVILLAMIVYIVAGAITSLIHTFKEVKAKKQASKFLKAMNTLAKAMETSKKEK